jgi:Flp pilus assembly protein TadB
MTVVWPALAGALTGAGLCLVIAGIWTAPVRIDAALARLAAPAPDLSQPAAAGGQLGRWLAARLDRPGGLVLPRADLAILGRAPEKFLADKLTAAVAGLLSFSLAGAFCVLAGIPVSPAAPVGAAVAAGVAMWWFPDWDVHAEAARRRRDFRYAWISYLQLVRLTRASGAGTTEALEYAAETGDGWAFGRIADAIAGSRRAHEPPWQGLAALGAQIGVPDVTEFAATAEIAGSEGAGMAETLAAKTASLAGQMQADARARANSRTTTMIVPLSLMGLGFVLLLAWPAFYTLLYGT